MQSLCDLLKALNERKRANEEYFPICHNLDLFFFFFPIYKINTLLANLKRSGRKARKTGTYCFNNCVSIQQNITFVQKNKNNNFILVKIFFSSKITELIFQPTFEKSLKSGAATNLSKK